MYLYNWPLLMLSGRITGEVCSAAAVLRGLRRKDALLLSRGDRGGCSAGTQRGGVCSSQHGAPRCLAEGERPAVGGCAGEETQRCHQDEADTTQDRT